MHTEHNILFRLQLVHSEKRAWQPPRRPRRPRCWSWPRSRNIPRPRLCLPWPSPHPCSPRSGRRLFIFQSARLQKSQTNQSTMQLYVTLVFLCNIVNLTISFAARALIIVWSSLKSLLSPTKMICCNYNKFWDFGFWISCFGKLTNRSFLKCWIF